MPKIKIEERDGKKYVTDVFGVEHRYDDLEFAIDYLDDISGYEYVDGKLAYSAYGPQLQRYFFFKDTE